MRFARDVFPPAEATLSEAEICNRMRNGWWLVESCTNPPPEHLPDRLLAGTRVHGGMALSVCSATLLQLDLGCALIERLASDGCLLSSLAPLALHEVLVNAAIHGNLCIKSGLSVAWTDLAWRQQHISRALDDAALAARAVTVAFGWDAGSLSAVVADEGDGYCPPIPEPADTNRRGAGRGLLIARAAAQVDVFDHGRCTRLVFGRSLSSAAGQAP